VAVAVVLTEETAVEHEELAVLVAAEMAPKQVGMHPQAAQT